MSGQDQDVRSFKNVARQLRALCQTHLHFINPPYNLFGRKEESNPNFSFPYLTHGKYNKRVLSTVSTRDFNKSKLPPLIPAELCRMFSYSSSLECLRPLDITIKDALDHERLPAVCLS